MEKGTVGIAQFIFTENSKKSYVPVGSYCQHAWYNQFSVGCMKWQHALILEPIWETDLIIIFLPAELTGILTRLLTCVTLRPFSLLLSWKNLFSVQFLFLLLFGQKYSKSQFPLLFVLPGQKNVNPIPILRKYSKSNFPSDLKNIPLFAYPFHTLATGVKTVSTKASFSISVCEVR